MSENIDKFIAEFKRSLEKRTFVKLTLGNYKGGDSDLQKLQVRLIETKRGVRLFFLYRGRTRDTAKNHEFAEGPAMIADLLASGFKSAHLFTTENDHQLEVGKNGRSRLNVGKPSFKSPPSLRHDREKKRLIDPNAYYLKALGVTNDAGQVRDRQQDKWRQINRFVEILSRQIDRSDLAGRDRLAVADMGAGKGYLTFAAYDYLTSVRGIKVEMTGVEMRHDLVLASNEIAAAGGLDGLHFIDGTIDSFDAAGIDILVALHACDTATDDAIFKGIAAGAGIVIVAPCCQHELRGRIKPPAMLADVLKHGVMLERTTEFVTDSLRTLMLERSGYSTTLIDFVATEHTPKNLMIIGTRGRARTSAAAKLDAEIDELMRFYGVEHQRLVDLLRPLNARASA
ncbi:MAG: class I SAM-dependent methyltransferase [Pyrinomonadaceae bacterium]